MAKWDGGDGIRGWLKTRADKKQKSIKSNEPKDPPEVLAARDLIASIDLGGVPTNTLQINHVARNLGLDVSRKASPDETIERIREALLRHRNY